MQTCEILHHLLLFATVNSNQMFTNKIANDKASQSLEGKVLLRIKESPPVSAECCQDCERSPTKVSPQTLQEIMNP